MPPVKKKLSLAALATAKGSGPKAVAHVSGADVLGAKDRADTQVDRKNTALVPPPEVFENYKLGPDGQEMYELVLNRDLEAGLTTGVYTLISMKLPQVQYLVDFQNLVRDLVHGLLYALLAKQQLPRVELMRHALAALIFFSPKRIVPLPIAAQLITQEVLYTRMNPRTGDEFSMRTIAYALGQAVPILQINGSMGPNGFYTHSHESVDAVLRGIGEGLKAASLHVSGKSMAHAAVNAQRLRAGIEAGFEGVKQELGRRTLVMLLEKLMFWRRG